MRSNKRESQVLAEAGKLGDILPLAHMLAVSGGGDAGTFAAGLIAGWTTHGTRPLFKVVTGISAGALVAPFAFLGSEYDGVIRYVSNAIGPKDIFHSRNVSPAMALRTASHCRDSSQSMSLLRFLQRSHRNTPKDEYC